MSLWQQYVTMATVCHYGFLIVDVALQYIYVDVHVHIYKCTNISIKHSLHNEGEIEPLEERDSLHVYVHVNAASPNFMYSIGQMV